MNRVHWLSWLGGTAALLVLSASVEGEEKPSLSALRIEEPLVVDGVLDEEAWGRAEKGSGFRQYDPGREIPATEKTEFAILYDDDRLYLGVWCWDSQPGGVMARSMVRDDIFTGADFLYAFFDTFHDKRNGYIFAVNPTGAQYDALLSNNVERNQNWDGIWASRATITDEGWFAEIAIPFKTLSFDPEGTVWGFNMSRRIRRKNESVRWTAARQEIRTHNASEAGDVTGLEGMRQGRGIEFKPYVAGRYRDGSLGDGWEGDVGADLRYRITPGFSATVSYNTDFAETEVDERVVNFTRFPVFFPEKRDFFLEDSGIYNFGTDDEGLVPYFTRRVGLANGEIVPIQVASKLAGRLGNYNIGVTHALLDEQSGLDQQNVLAARVSRKVFAQSTVGTLLTAGNPAADRENYVGGLDFKFRTNQFLGDKIFSADAYILGSHDEQEGGGEARDYAYGLSLAYPNEVWDAELAYTEIGPSFDPALGFVRRRGVRVLRGEVEREHRPEAESWYREYGIGASAEFYHLIGGGLDSAEFTFMPVDLELASADELRFEIEHEIDRPREEFRLAEVTVPPGEYSWTSATLSYETTSRRPVWVDLGVQAGQFYDGWRHRLFGTLEWNPTRHFQLDLGYEYNAVDIDAGEFDTHVGSAGMKWNFTPDLTWSHLAQWDSVSDSVGVNSRLRWEYRPGSTLYLVLNQSYLSRDGRTELDGTDLTLKADATFRF